MQGGEAGWRFLAQPNASSTLTEFHVEKIGTPLIQSSFRGNLSLPWMEQGPREGDAKEDAGPSIEVFSQCMRTSSFGKMSSYSQKSPNGTIKLHYFLQSSMRGDGSRPKGPNQIFNSVLTLTLSLHPKFLNKVLLLKCSFSFFTTNK